MDIKKVLEQHKIWIDSLCKDGEEADLRQANLRAADLRKVNLSNANLSNANLRFASLREGDLRYANLREADLSCSDLISVNLLGANLNNADLTSANLSGADLRYVNLRGADLRYANLRGADLRYIDLSTTDLRGAYLPESTFIISGEQYFISICGDCVSAGCQSYLVNEWRQLSKSAILKMDGKASLKFYPRLLDIIDFYCGKGERPEWLKEQNND